MTDRLLEYARALARRSAQSAPAWNIERMRQGSGAAWNYADGCMLLALLSLGEAAGEREFFDFVLGFADPLISPDGAIEGYRERDYNLDNLCEGRVLFALYEKTGREKYRLAVERLHGQLLRQPRTASGNFWHKAIYPDQVWLDGIYMAQVFSALYEEHFGNGDYADILSQLETVRTNMFSAEKRLYFHGWDESRSVFWADPETGLSKSFWLRAMGWYAAALADLYAIVPPERGGERIAALLSELCGGIVPYRDGNGMYYQVVDQGGRQGNYPETSGSALIAYAMCKGARLGALDGCFAAYGKETYAGILKNALSGEGETLRLRGICLSAGLGPADNPRRDGSYAYYISEPVVENDAKGAAPLLMCCAELLRLSGSGREE